MDIASILNDNKTTDASAPAVATIPTDITNDDTSAQLDTLTSYTDDGKEFQFSANETISTNDNSSVGGYDEIKAISDTTAEEDVPPVNHKSDFEIVDPSKMDFIKTYTKEYDDLVASTTHAVELILNSIDKTVKDHSNDIAIPEEANPFLEKKPEGGKVTKFDEAQQIVRTVMAKATEAKSQAEQAALEASKIYDNIQQFKKDTKKQISDIRSRDEFGRVRKDEPTHQAPTASISSAISDGGESVSMPKISRGLN